jgi:hypothetical protein
MAGPGPVPVDSPTPQFIETKMDLGLFGLLGGSMEYSLNGKKITHYQDFKNLIYSLHDEEASRFIHDAEEEDFLAWMIDLAGVAAGTDMALFFKPTPFLHDDFIDRIGTGLLVSQFFVATGAIFEINAEGRKYNAVQRYNQLVRAPRQSFLGLHPQLYVENNGVHLGFALPF